MSVIGIDETRQLEVLRLVSAILHIGNITFKEEKNYAAIFDRQCKFHFSYYYFRSPRIPCLSAGTEGG